MIVGVDRRIMTVGCIAIVAVLVLFGGLMAVHNHEQDTEPRYEIEMADGTIYLCNDYLNKDNDTTRLYHVDGIKGNTVKVIILYDKMGPYDELVQNLQRHNLRFDLSEEELEELSRKVKEVLDSDPYTLPSLPECREGEDERQGNDAQHD